MIFPELNKQQLNTSGSKERMLKAIMGKPTVQQASLERFIMSLDEDVRKSFEMGGLRCSRLGWDPKKWDIIGKQMRIFWGYRQ